MGRTPCCDKDGLKRGPWTPEEDRKLMDYIQKHGSGSWRTLPKNAGLSRCGKSCRLRWTNYLRPDIKRGRFSFEEEQTIIQLHSILGNKWSAIAARLPGRTDNEIKNYWNTHIRKRLLHMGIDPVTHTPRLDLLHLSSLLTNPTLFNPASQPDVSNLLGIDQLVNPEFLIIASNLLSSNENSLMLQDQPFQFSNPTREAPSCTTSSSHHFYNDDQSQLLQFQPNIYADQTNLGQAKGMQCNFLPSATTTSALGYENLEQSAPQYVADNSNFYLPNNQNYNISMTNSVLSTPVSSPSLTTQLNSSSTYINSSSTATEDERESNCCELFKFHIPDLLDVSEFLQFVNSDIY